MNISRRTTRGERVRQRSFFTTRGIFPVLLALPFSACGGDTTGPEPEFRSEHFLFVDQAGDATHWEIEEGMRKAEAHHTAIAAILGRNRIRARTITVMLGGSVGTCSQTRVDEEGRILLCRHPPRFGGYYGALAHELTHAMRYDFWIQHSTWRWPSFGFYEDGFAEFVALLVDPAKTGFPFFGYPVDLVAGYWVVSGQAVPHDILRPRNQELNDPCQNQAYTQRASWFRYIDETYGRSAVLSLAYSEVEITTDVAETVLGIGLGELDSDWMQWATARYEAIPRADSLARAYRRWVPESAVCLAGVDFYRTVNTSESGRNDYRVPQSHPSSL